MSTTTAPSRRISCDGDRHSKNCIQHSDYNKADSELSAHDSKFTKGSAKGQKLDLQALARELNINQGHLSKDGSLMRRSARSTVSTDLSSGNRAQRTTEKSFTYEEDTVSSVVRGGPPYYDCKVVGGKKGSDLTDMLAEAVDRMTINDPYVSPAVERGTKRRKVDEDTTTKGSDQRSPYNYKGWTGKSEDVSLLETSKFTTKGAESSFESKPEPKMGKDKDDGPGVILEVQGYKIINKYPHFLIDYKNYTSEQLEFWPLENVLDGLYWNLEVYDVFCENLRTQKPAEHAKLIKAQDKWAADHKHLIVAARGPGQPTHVGKRPSDGKTKVPDVGMRRGGKRVEGNQSGKGAGYKKRETGQGRK